MEEMGHIGYKTDRHLEWYLKFKMQDKENYDKKNKINKTCAREALFKEPNTFFILKALCYGTLLSLLNFSLKHT